MRTLAQTILLVVFGSCSQAYSQTDKMNFRERQAIVINNAPQHIELSRFTFENKFS